MVGVGLGLRTREQLLSRVLRDGWNHRGCDLGARLGVVKRRLGREVDLLLGELVVDVRVDEAVAPGQETSGHEQHDNGNHTAGACENVEYYGSDRGCMRLIVASKGLRALSTSPRTDSLKLRSLVRGGTPLEGAPSCRAYSPRPGLR
jgi:hypothetical protein